MELTPLTFGVEIETVCLYSYPFSLNPEPSHTDKLAPALRIPPDRWSQSAMTIRHRMADVVSKIDVPDRVRPPGRGVLNYEDAPFLHWEFKGDTSINEQSARHVGYEDFEGIEITSPILWATEASFEYVGRVLQVLTDNFRLRINVTTGLHVHIARGVRRHFSQRELRYFGALIWSAEHVLDTLQPPERRSNMYSECIRSYSHMARGRFAEDDDFGGYRSGKALHSVASSETSLGSDRYERSKLEVRFSSPQETSPLLEEAVRTAFRLSSARTQMPRPDPEHDKGQVYRRRNSATFGMPPLIGARPPVFVDSAREGARHLLECKDRHDVATLLCWRDDRLAWNFAPWAKDDDRRKWFSKMTVECRAGHGSVSPSWIATWARIVVGVAAFAIDAPRVKYFEVLDRLGRAEEDDGRFIVDDEDKPRRKKLSERATGDAVSSDDEDYFGQGVEANEGVLYGYPSDEEEEQEEMREKEERENSASSPSSPETAGKEKEGNQAKEKKRKEIKKPCTYDVVDFLQDIGLFAEAMYIEKYLLKNPDKFWFPHHPLMQQNGGGRSRLSRFGVSRPRVLSEGGRSSDSSWEPAFVPRDPMPEPCRLSPPIETTARTESLSDIPPPGQSLPGQSLPPPSNGPSWLASYDPADYADLYYNSDEDPIPPPLPHRNTGPAAETNRNSHASDATVIHRHDNPSTEQSEAPGNSSTVQSEDAENPSSTQQNEASENFNDRDEGAGSMLTGS